MATCAIPHQSSDTPGPTIGTERGMAALAQPITGEVPLSFNDLGFAVFSPGGSVPGYNPSIANISPCQNFTRTYTTTADFTDGQLVGAAAINNNVVLTLSGSTYEFAWIANSGDGTVSKVNTTTGREVARYRTGSIAGGTLSPSRTAVDRDGNCWVANRNPGSVALVIQIVAEGGVDRNGNGNIETSSDLNQNGIIEGNELLAWGTDERIVRNYQVGTGFPDNYARALTIDKAGFLWVGLWNSDRIVKVRTDLPTATYGPEHPAIQVPEEASVNLAETVPGINGRPYGLALSPNGLLYAATLGPLAFEIDPGQASGGVALVPQVRQMINHSGRNYGIAVDRNCIVWIAKYDRGTSASHGCVRWDPTAQTFTESQAGAPGPGRGITVDFEGNIWMATNNIAGGPDDEGVTKYAPTVPPTWLANYPTPAIDVPVGVGVSSDGNIIISGRETTVWNKVDKDNGAITPLSPHSIGNIPYTYSDFTGSLRNLVSEQQGFWSAVTDGGNNGIRWNQLSWNSTVPAATELIVEYRVASTTTLLKQLPFQLSPVPGAITPAIQGRYIETRVRLISDRQCGNPYVTPVLHDLTVSAICDTCTFAGCQNDITVACTSFAGAVVSYTPPFFPDNCGSVYGPIICYPASGSLFPIGQTTVKCQSLNQTTGTQIKCSFVVTVTGSCINVPLGACCLYDDCSLQTREYCESRGGIYLGDGSNCLNACTSACVPPPAGLIAWWPLSLTGGTSTKNFADPKRPASVQGSPASVVGEYVGNSIAFDGDPDHLLVMDGSSIDLGTSSFTLSAWVRTTTTAHNPILDKRVGGGVTPYQGYALYLRDGYPGLSLSSTGTTRVFPLSDSNGGPGAFMADGTWHHLAVIVRRNSSTGVQFYIDGTPVGSTFNPMPVAGSLDTDTNLFIGRSYPYIFGPTYFVGAIDEVMMYRRRLTATEIVAMYGAQQFGLCHESCYAPRLVQCCYANSTPVTMSICNYSGAVQVYSWGLTPSSGSGCTSSAAIPFTPSTGTLTVGAGMCAKIQVTAECPSGMGKGQIACYQLNVFNHTTGNYFGCPGSIRKPVRWCFEWYGGLGNMASTAVELQPDWLLSTLVTVRPLDGEPPITGPIDYRFLAVTQAPDSIGSALSLNGLALGTPFDGTASLFPDGHAEFAVTIESSDSRSIGFEEIHLMVDDDLDGILDPIGLSGITGELLPEATGVPELPPEPGAIKLGQFLSLPNPFSAESYIRYELVGAASSMVTIEIFDLAGRRRRTLLDGVSQAAGTHTVRWDARDENGTLLSVGIYFLKFETRDRVETVKIALIR